MDVSGVWIQCLWWMDVMCMVYGLWCVVEGVWYPPRDTIAVHWEGAPNFGAPPAQENTVIPK